MAAEENEHRRLLIDLYESKFGSHIPLIRRQDVLGFVQRKRLWQVRLQGIDAVRQQARQMEQDAGRFYQHAASRATDAAVPKLLGDLAAAELQHERTAGEIEGKRLPRDTRGKEDDNDKRSFILQIVQPGLVGLMDGSVSTLAPVFAAAFGTHNPWTAFQVGMAASLGAGISMGFAEALADDGNPASDHFVIKTIIGYAFPVPGGSSGASERATASSPTNPMSRSTARLGQP